MRLRPEDGDQGLQISDCRPETIAARSETKGGYAPTWFVSDRRCEICDQDGLSPDPVCGPGQWRRGLQAGTCNLKPATWYLGPVPGNLEHKPLNLKLGTWAPAAGAESSNLKLHNPNPVLGTQTLEPET